MVNTGENLNFKVTQGDSFLLEITYETPDQDPIDISDFLITLEVKDKPGGKTLCAACTIGDGITLSDPVNGKFEVNISPEKTRKFNFPKSSYQIQGTSDSNQNITFLQGWFSVNAGTIN